MKKEFGGDLTMYSIKVFSIALLTLFISTVSHKISASPLEVYKGDAIWEKNDTEHFSALELSGIRLDAIQSALSRCQFAGYRYCLLKHTYLAKDEVKESSRLITYEALVQQIDTLLEEGAIQMGETIEANSFVETDMMMGELAEIGVRAKAFDLALIRCHALEYDMCAIGISGTVDQNKWTGIQYRTSAVATVIGFDINL